MKILLVIITIIGLSAVIGAVIVGTSTFDGTVVDKPYEHGLAYDTAHHDRESSGWKTEILNKAFRTGKNSIVLSVTDRDDKPLQMAKVTLKISRPSSSQYDRSYMTTENGKGRMTAEVDLPLYGYWNVKIDVTDEDKRTISYERLIFAEADPKK